MHGERPVVRIRMGDRYPDVRLPIAKVPSVRYDRTIRVRREGGVEMDRPARRSSPRAHRKRRHRRKVHRDFGRRGVRGLAIIDDREHDREPSRTHEGMAHNDPVPVEPIAEIPFVGNDCPIGVH